MEFDRPPASASGTDGAGDTPSDTSEHGGRGRRGLGRRAFLTSGAAATAVGTAGGFLGAGQASAVGLVRQAPAAGAPAPGGADPTTARQLARYMLLVSDDEKSDLKLEYLKVLIDGQLPPATGHKKVLVVGAGVAGMTAAMLLKQAGHQVVVIEANGNRTGGRVKTFRGIFSDKRLHAEAGAMRLPDFHPLVLALGDKLGLKRRLFYNADVAPGAEPTGPLPPVVYTSFTGEKWTNGPDHGGFTAPAATGNSLITVNGIRQTRNQYAASPTVVNRSFGSNISSTTTTALTNALQPVTVTSDKPIDQQLSGWQQVFEQYGDYSTGRFLLENAGWDVPTVQAVGTIENATSRLHYSLVPTLIDHSYISPTNRYWEFEDGTASLTDALAAGLKDELKMGRRMVSLTQTDRGVTITTTAESGTEDSCDGGPIAPTEQFTGDYAIITIPFSALRFCDIDPVFSYGKRRAITELHYDSATKVLLEFKTRFWESGPGGFTGGGNVSDSPSRFTYFPSHAPQGSPGGVVLASYSWSDDAMRWDSLLPEERYDFALNDLAKVYGDQVRQQFTGVGATQSWARARYALGEAVIYTPGQIHELHPQARTVEGRVHFAGEHTSLKPAWIEGALESAVRTFLEVNAR